MNFIVFSKYTLNSISILATYFKNIYHFVMLPFLFTILKMFQDWKHQEMKRFRCNYVPFFLQTSLKVCNGMRSSFCISKCAKHSLLGTSQDYRRPGPAPAHSSSSAMPLKCVQNVVLHCLVEICMASLERMSSWRQHMLLQNLYVLSGINCAITEA